MTLSPKCCSSTYRIHVLTFGGAQSCIHSMLYAKFFSWNSGIAIFSNKYGHRTNVLAVLHNIVIVTSCKNIVSHYEDFPDLKILIMSNSASEPVLEVYILRRNVPHQPIISRVATSYIRHISLGNN